MTNSQLDTGSVLSGAVLGLASWLSGYAFIYLLVASDIRESSLNRIIEAFEGEPAIYEMVGWVFYNAHMVNTVFSDIPLIGSQTATYVGGEDGFTALLYLIPVALLCVAGVVLARYQQAESPTDGALAGVLVVPGYFIVSVVGVFLFEVTLGGAQGGPDFLPAVFLAGLVYPLVFAGGAGALTGLLTDE